MQPIQIQVQITIGVENALLNALSALMNRAAVPAMVSAPEPTKPTEQEPPTEEQEAPPAPVATEEPQLDVQEPVKEYTEVDVRAAMDRTRKRIEGENYRESPDSEGYKKWHKVLTGWFKNTAAFFGAEKPSALPDSESRYRFIQCCEEVKVVDNKLVGDCPF